MNLRFKEKIETNVTENDKSTTTCTTTSDYFEFTANAPTEVEVGKWHEREVDLYNWSYHREDRFPRTTLHLKEWDTLKHLDNVYYINDKQVWPEPPKKEKDKCEECCDKWYKKCCTNEDK